MAEAFKIDQNSVCPSCMKTPTQTECVQCFICKSAFHGICESTDNDTKLGTNTLIKTFLAPSTKNNFKFFCDKCMTEFERNLVETQAEKISNLEKNFLGLESKLEEITKLLKVKGSGTGPGKETKPVSHRWSDVVMAGGTVKAPTATSVLVVKKAEDEEKRRENKNMVETAIMQSDISVVESYQNKSGDLMVVCESENIRNQLKDIVISADDEVVVSAPRGIRHSITIVGLDKEYQKEEVIDRLVKQNGFIKKFSESNNIGDHIRMHAVKPLKNNASCFQVFCDVSSFMREWLGEYKDKVTLGLTLCKIYDRYSIKRCYNCQKFGHYAKECPTKEVPVCGICSGHHLTRGCESLVRKCINCVEDDNDYFQHATSDTKCPCLINEQNKLKKKLNSARLNLMSLSVRPHR